MESKAFFPLLLDIDVLEKSIREGVRLRMKRRLNAYGKNVTEKRVDAVVRTIRDEYGFRHAGPRQISDEVATFIRRLVGKEQGNRLKRLGGRS